MLKINIQSKAQNNIVRLRQNEMGKQIYYVIPIVIFKVLNTYIPPSFGHIYLFLSLLANKSLLKASLDNRNETEAAMYPPDAILVIH